MNEARHHEPTARTGRISAVRGAVIDVNFTEGKLPLIETI